MWKGCPIPRPKPSRRLKSQEIEAPTETTVTCPAAPSTPSEDSGLAGAAGVNLRYRPGMRPD